MILFLYPNTVVRVAIASAILAALTGLPTLARTRSQTTHTSSAEASEISSLRENPDFAKARSAKTDPFPTLRIDNIRRRSDIPPMPMREEQRPGMMGELHQMMGQMHQSVAELTPEQMHELHPLMRAHHQQMMGKMQQFIEQIQQSRSQRIEGLLKSSHTPSNMPMMPQQQQHQMMAQMYEKMAQMHQIMAELTPEQMRELHPLMKAHHQQMMEQMQQFIEQIRQIRDRDGMEGEIEN